MAISSRPARLGCPDEASAEGCRVHRRLVWFVYFFHICVTTSLAPKTDGWHAHYERCLVYCSEVLGFTKWAGCVNCVTDRRGVRERCLPCRLPPGLTSPPLSLQFFLFILIIFLAELSAAILAFIFRENVRTGPHARRLPASQSHPRRVSQSHQPLIQHFQPKP